MKKIGIYVNVEPFSGGAYQYVRSVVDALANVEKEEYKVCVYSLDDKWEEVCKKFDLPLKKITYTLFQRAMLSIAWRIHKERIFMMVERHFSPLWKAYKKDKLDLLIIPEPDVPWKKKNIKTIVTIYDLMHRYIGYFPEVGGEDIFELRDKRYRKICISSSGVLVDSELGKKQVVDCYGELMPNLGDKVFSLPFTAPDYLHEQAQKIEIFDKYFYYPAQFWKHKNHKNLILAISKLKQKGLIINVIFSGKEKNNKAEIEELIKEKHLESQVKIYDYVSNNELIYLYQNARALVMPTYAGPTNIPPLEAMELGCPMMVSNNFAMPEQVGDAALTFNPDSVDEMADCMEKLWNNDELCQNLIEAGKIQREIWGKEQFKNRLLEIIDSVIMGE